MAGRDSRLRALWGAVLGSCILAATSARGEMPVTFLTVDPVAGAHYGWGYNLTTKQFTAPCITYNSGATYSSGDPDQGSTFQFVENTSEIVSKSNLSVSAALKVLAAGTTYKADNKTEVAAGTQTSTYSQALFANAYRYEIPKFLDIAQVSFKPEARNLLAASGGKGQFREQCGDGFVIGIQSGREFIGTATITKQNLKSWTQFASKTGASASGTWGSASGSVDIGKLLEQTFGSQNIVVKTYSTGSSKPNPTQASELTTYFQNFLSSEGPQKTVKLIVAPYQLVGNYPWENPLQGSDKEDYIGMMVSGLWELKAAIRDADFVLDPTTSNMFALGTSEARKKERLDYIRQTRDAWQGEYDMLLKAAQQCNDQFTPSCRSLAEFYDRNRNLTAQRYAVLPDRYLSDCNQKIILTDATQRLKNALAQQNFGTPVIGDAETAGSPSRVVAELLFRPDKTQLKATLSVMKMEWNKPLSPGEAIAPKDSNLNHYSTWGMQAQATLFDLQNPQQYGGGTENLKYCTWKGNGVDFREISAPRADKALVQFGFGNSMIHGYIDGKSGEDPRGQVHFGNGRGALEYITCEVDRKGNDNNMQCLDLGVRNVALNLVSTQDQEADGWVKPPVKPAIPAALASFSQNQAVSSKDNEQFRSFRVKLSPEKMELVNASEKRRTAILSGLKTTKGFSLPKEQLELIQMRLKPLSPSQLKPITR